MSRLHTSNIEVGYGSKPIIENLTLTIPDKKITSIIGANGCGKSTLLKSMARIIPYQKGHVFLDGKAIHQEQTKLLAKKLAMLPQKPGLVEGLTVKELVSYGRYPHQKSMTTLSEHDLEVIQWAMNVTGIDEYNNQDVNALSGGQLQRVWIAMALAQETDIIFLDEPTTYLDLAHQLEILELLKRLNEEQERTIVMVLHDINQAARFSDHIIAMKSGQIIKSGDNKSIMTSQVLREVYNIEAFIGKDPMTDKPMCLSYRMVN